MIYRKLDTLFSSFPPDWGIIRVLVAPIHLHGCVANISQEPRKDQKLLSLLVVEIGLEK